MVLDFLGESNIRVASYYFPDYQNPELRFYGGSALPVLNCIAGPQDLKCVNLRKIYARTSFASTFFESSTEIFTPSAKPTDWSPWPPYPGSSHSMNSATARSPQRRPPTIYYCDCPRYCKVRKAVKKTTFYEHAPYRNPLRSLGEHESALRLFLDGDIGAADHNSSREPLPKKRRLASPVQSDSDDSDSGLATMLPSDDPPPLARGDSEGFGEFLLDADDFPDPGSVVDPNQLHDDDNPDPIVDVPSPRPESTTPPLSPRVPPDDAPPDPPPAPPPPPPGPDRPIYERLSSIPDIEAAQLFIKALESASLDESGLVISYLREAISYTFCIIFVFRGLELLFNISSSTQCLMRLTCQESCRSYNKLK
ncbi:hypothetical protein B0H14DRAFT_2575536 [Mycena olivaceomarginata]|nr:hypothetical protein B0H14DRAFT_2575536 [Mycena olivaceomarginata]